jgi:hypothetical protein
MSLRGVVLSFTFAILRPGHRMYFFEYLAF